VGGPDRSKTAARRRRSGQPLHPRPRNPRQATAQRFADALAFAATDNAITEFLPDSAKKIHVWVVLIHQIINQIANKDAANSP
jgi:hypothetical protein